MGNAMKPGPRTENGDPYCCYCLNEETVEEELFSFPCPKEQHVVCGPCMKKYFRSTIFEKKRSFMLVGCPHKGCRGIATQEMVNKWSDDETAAFIAEMKKTVPSHNGGHYKLSDFNYEYNDKEELRHKVTGDSFYYITERHYEALGECIIRTIQGRMKNELGMKEHFVDEETKVNNIFISPGALEKDKLMMLIQGSGAVRPGQWARALCFNDSLKTGAQLEYIKEAYEKGYGVVVFNPNENVRQDPPIPNELKYDFYDTKKVIPHKSEKRPLEGSESKAHHTLTVFDRWVRKSRARHFVIVAHSAGGYCTKHLMDHRLDVLLPRLRAIAFTDAFFNIEPNDHPKCVEFFRTKAINWVTSKKPLNQIVKKRASKMSAGFEGGCEMRSAGHTDHTMTSACCQKPLFEFIEKHVQEREEEAKRQLAQKQK